MNHKRTQKNSKINHRPEQSISDGNRKGRDTIATIKAAENGTNFAAKQNGAQAGFEDALSARPHERAARLAADGGEKPLSPHRSTALAPGSNTRLECFTEDAEATGEIRGEPERRAVGGTTRRRSAYTGDDAENPAAGEEAGTTRARRCRRRRALAFLPVRPARLGTGAATQKSLSPHSLSSRNAL